MDSNRFDNQAPPPVPPSQAIPSPPPPIGSTNEPQAAQPSTAFAKGPDGKRSGRSKLFKVLVGLALLSVVSVVVVVGALAVAVSVGVFDEDQIDANASSDLDQQDVAAEGDSEGSSREVDEEDLTRATPTTPDGVTITWADSPTSCDGNDKRLFSADVVNGTSEAFEVTMRILDPDNNFVHGSHIYVVPASGETLVHLGGIPAGQSIVQIIAEPSDEAIGETNVRFENC